MPAVNLAPYDAQMAELERRQRIAQALAEAGATPQDAPSYKGISAMPSRTGMLANVLKSFVGARQERNIGRERMALGEQDAAAGRQFSKQSLADLLAASSPQAAAPAQPPAAPPQAAPAGGSYNPPSGAGLTGVATNPDTLAAAMGGAAPQAAPAPQAKVPGGNSPPPAMTLDQLQATIAAGLASPYPSVRAQAQAMMPMVNQRLGREQQVADRAQERSDRAADYQQRRTDAISDAEKLAEARDKGYEIITPGDGYTYIVDPEKASEPTRGILARIGEGKAMYGPTAAQTATMPRVGNEAEYNALSKGQSYIDPDGNIRRKS